MGKPYPFSRFARHIAYAAEQSGFYDIKSGLDKDGPGFVVAPCCENELFMFLCALESRTPIVKGRCGGYVVPDDCVGKSLWAIYLILHPLSADTLLPEDDWNWNNDVTCIVPTC